MKVYFFVFSFFLLSCTESTPFKLSETKLLCSKQENCVQDTSRFMLSRNRYETLKRLEKDKKKHFIFSANKKIKRLDYTKLFLAEIQYTLTEWSFYAVHNEEEYRENRLVDQLLENRMLYFTGLKEEDETFMAFWSETNPIFQKSDNMRLFAKSGNRTFKNRSTLCPLYLNKHNRFGFESDFLHIPYAHSRIGTRNGAFIELKLGNLERTIYRVEKMLVDKNSQEKYLKLRNKDLGDVIYLKSVSEENRKIKIPDNIELIAKDIASRVKKIKGDSRLKKSGYYMLTGLHVFFITSYEVSILPFLLLLYRVS